MLRQLARESAVYGLAKILPALLAIATLPLFTRAFSLEDYGTLALITSFIAVLPSIFGLSLESAYTRFWKDSGPRPDDLLGILLKFQLVYGLPVSVLIFVLVRIWLIHKGQGHLQGIVGLVLAGAWVAQFVLTFQLAARMRHDLKTFLSIALTGSLLGPLASVLFVFWNASLLSYFAGWLVGVLVALGVGLMSYPPPAWGGMGTVSLGRVRPLLKFSLPLLPAAAATAVHGAVDRWAVGWFLSTADVGIYAVGSKVASFAGLGVSVLTFAFLPHSMKIIRLEQQDANICLRRLLRYFSLIGCVGAVVLQLAAPLLVGLVAAPEYAAASPLVGILALAAIFFGYTYFSTLGSWKAEKSADYSFAVGLGLGLGAGACFFLVPRIGNVGAALGSALGMLGTAAASFGISHWRHPYAYDFSRLIWTNGLTLAWLGFYLRAWKQDETNLSILAASLILLVLLVAINLSKGDQNRLRAPMITKRGGWRPI